MPGNPKSNVSQELASRSRVYVMENATDQDWCTVRSNFCNLAELFCNAICTGQITYKEWYDLMTAPFNESFSVDDEDLITRLIYAVRQGRVKIIE
jgi:hypothetical protein